MVKFIKVEDRLLKEVEGVEVIDGIAYEEVLVEEIEQEIANIEMEEIRLAERKEELQSFLPAEEDLSEEEGEDELEEDGEEEEVEETLNY